MLRLADDDVFAAKSPSRWRARAAAARDAADQVERRQQIHRAQQVADHDLAEAQPQALLVHDAQAQQPLAEGLAAPAPLQQDAVADRDGEEAPAI